MGPFRLPPSVTVHTDGTALPFRPPPFALWRHHHTGTQCSYRKCQLRAPVPESCRTTSTHPVSISFPPHIPPRRQASGEILQPRLLQVRNHEARRLGGMERYGRSSDVSRGCVLAVWSNPRPRHDTTRKHRVFRARDPAGRHRPHHLVRTKCGISHPPPPALPLYNHTRAAKHPHSNPRWQLRPRAPSPPAGDGGDLCSLSFDHYLYAPHTHRTRTAHTSHAPHTPRTRHAHAPRTTPTTSLALLPACPQLTRRNSTLFCSLPRTLRSFGGLRVTRSAPPVPRTMPTSLASLSAFPQLTPS